MRPLTEAQIRASFINTSKRERANVTLPAGPGDIDWESLDYLGWRDPKLARVGYLVTWIDDEPVGLSLQKSDIRPRTRAQCSWCADIHLPNDVVFYATKRVGAAGRRGDTVGTLICEHFECSINVRKLPPSAYLGFDREAARQSRILALQENVDRFVRDVQQGRD